jgi:hypothetical protein
VLVCFCVIHLTDSPFSASLIPHIIGACAGVLFLVGLWTPFVGTLIAVAELWIAMSHFSDPWVSIMLAIQPSIAARSLSPTVRVDNRTAEAIHSNQRLLHNVQRESPLNLRRWTVSLVTNMHNGGATHDC